MLQLAEGDERIVAGAAVGSLAVGSGDRFSDLDLTFAVADHVPVAEVLDDWTRRLSDELAAVRLVDLERGPTIYRVFLLPDALQFDLSLTPAAHCSLSGSANARGGRQGGRGGEYGRSRPTAHGTFLRLTRLTLYVYLTS